MVYYNRITKMPFSSKVDSKEIGSTAVSSKRFTATLKSVNPGIQSRNVKLLEELMAHQ